MPQVHYTHKANQGKKKIKITKKILTITSFSKSQKYLRYFNKSQKMLKCLKIST